MRRRTDDPAPVIVDPRFGADLCFLVQPGLEARLVQVPDHIQVAGVALGQRLETAQGRGPFAGLDVGQPFVV